MADERNLARQLIKDELPVDGSLFGKVFLQPFSWDDPDGGVPLLATLTPQEAVNRGLGRPAECDIVVVILWSRMGTPLPADQYRKANGEPYWSGSEWEFEDARAAGRDVLIYHCSEEPKVGLRDPDRAEKERQFQLVERFFSGFRNPDGSYNTGVKSYARAGEFRDKLEQDLRTLIRQRLDRAGTAEPPLPVAPVQLWHGSPYPGLRAFEHDQALIFFGRARETDQLLARLRDPTCRFLAVIGDSGVGKSSLLRAGLLPRLAGGALTGSAAWPIAVLKPAEQGDDPFLALANALNGVLPPSARRPPKAIAGRLASDPSALAELVASALSCMPAEAELILLVDQLEELFALPLRDAFIGLLTCATSIPGLRTLASLRADFYPAATRDDRLAALLRSGSFPLAPPGLVALSEMIRWPAERAGATVTDDLLQAILDDCGRDPGALPLVAFALAELWPEQGAAANLTVAGYEAIGRLHGAIGRRAAALGLDAAERPMLLRLFSGLVQLDADGITTRRRIPRDRFAADPDVAALVDLLVEQRFLIASGAAVGSTVELAHEALLAGWSALKAGWSSATHICAHVGKSARHSRGGRSRTRATKSCCRLVPACGKPRNCCAMRRTF